MQYRDCRLLGLSLPPELMQAQGTVNWLCLYGSAVACGYSAVESGALQINWP